MFFKVIIFQSLFFSKIYGYQKILKPFYDIEKMIYQIKIR